MRATGTLELVRQWKEKEDKKEVEKAEAKAKAKGTEIDEVWGGDLYDNPYQFKGKKIKVTELSYHRMISSTKALMYVPDSRYAQSGHPGVVLSGVKPKHHEKLERSSYYIRGPECIFIGKVKGTTKVTEPFWGEVSLPEVELLE